MSNGTLAPETTLDDLILRIRETSKNPNVGKITEAVLKEGPRAYKIATLLEVLSNGEFHHYVLKINHIDKSKAAWTYKPEKSVSLEGKDPNEIDKLYKLLHTTQIKKSVEKTGDHRLISAAEYQKYETITSTIQNEINPNLELLNSLLSRLDTQNTSVEDFVNAFDGSNDETLKQISIASRVVEYRRAIDELKLLVDDPTTPEGVFQKHLEANPWMFGSEYSELLSRKSWTRDNRLDYMLRKTVDDYLEIIEIKKAFTEPLFRLDESHNSYYPSSKLSSVIGQVVTYIEDVERNRNSIIAMDNEDTLKIRARVIVGRSGSQEQQAALRNLNSHLYRIEILTYDQLIRIAERVLNLFGVKIKPYSTPIDIDIPF